MTPDEYVDRMNMNFSLGRLAALREVREMVAAIDIGPMASFGSASGAFVRTYISNEMAAMIAKEEK